MQSAAFAATRLPHSYALVDMESVEEFVNSDFWNDEAFGGCSVTIPHKQNIIPHLDILTEAAKSIGAVNTVIANYPESEHRDSKDIEKRVLIGDNTDWKGIFNPLSRKLGKSPIPKTNDDVSNDPKHGDEQKKTEVALILGGGGTARAAAYAATKLGLEKIYYNRTPSKVQELAEQFGGKVVTSLEGGKIIDPIAEKFNFEVKSSKEKVTDNSSESLSLGDLLEEMNGEVRVIISTLPASAEFELPSWFVQNVKNGNGKVPKPIIFDVNYKPYWTNLLRQADRFSFPIVRGSEMLWEQGVGQFELWTGRTAPYKVMKGVVLKNCLPPKEEEE
jgi:pentafunctional AROM polypeptide